MQSDVIKLHKKLCNVLRYAFYCLLLIDLDYFQTIYYENYLNKLIIALMKIGRDATYLQDQDKAEAKKEIDKIVKLYFEDLLKDV